MERVRWCFDNICDIDVLKPLKFMESRDCLQVNHVAWTHLHSGVSKWRLRMRENEPSIIRAVVVAAIVVVVVVVATFYSLVACVLIVARHCIISIVLIIINSFAVIIK
jgi:hypothetical protein